MHKEGNSILKNMNDQEVLSNLCHFPLLANHYTENDDRKIGKIWQPKYICIYEPLNINCIIFVTLYIS